MFAVGGQPDTFGVCVSFGVDEIVVGVVGQLDLATAPRLGSILAVVLDQPGTDIVLDLAGVEFMDVAGLRVITSTSSLLRPSGRALALRSVPSTTRNMIAVSGLAALVDFEASGSRTTALGAEQHPADHSALVPRQAPPRSALSALGTVASPDDVVDAALRMVVALTKATVKGADGVSVTLDRRDELTTVAATDDTIAQMDRDQYDTAQGPCVSAAGEGRWFHVEALAAETRWPDFIPRAIDGGIGSILSTPLLVGSRSVGALNIYSTAERSFGAPEQELAAMFATQASGILTDAGINVAIEELGQRLHRALQAREVIAQAQGVLMARTGMSSDDASAGLRRTARDARMSVAQAAADVVASTGRQTKPGAGSA